MQVAKLQLGSDQQVQDMCTAQLPCTSHQGNFADDDSPAKQFVVLAATALSTSKQLSHEQGLLSVLEVCRAQQEPQRSGFAQLSIVFVLICTQMGSPRSNNPSMRQR